MRGYITLSSGWVEAHCIARNNHSARAELESNKATVWDIILNYTQTIAIQTNLAGSREVVEIVLGARDRELGKQSSFIYFVKFKLDGYWRNTQGWRDYKSLFQFVD